MHIKCRYFSRKTLATGGVKTPSSHYPLFTAEGSSKNAKFCIEKTPIFSVLFKTASKRTGLIKPRSKRRIVECIYSLSFKTLENA